MLRKTEILVSGGGLVGLTAAIALAQSGWQVVLCAPETAEKDTRTTAFLWDTVEYFNSLGLWEKLGKKAFPLKTMRIVDGTKRLLRAPQTDFHSSEIGLEAFGYNLKNSEVLEVLNECASDNESIQRIAGMVTSVETGVDGINAVIESSDKTLEISVGFVAAADGRNSLIRNSLLPGERSWKYPQTAIVVDFQHEISTNFVSTEFHTETGPFTIVPRSHDLAGLVWLETPERSEQLLNMPNPELEAEIEQKMQSFLGKIKLANEPRSFPMAGLVADRFGSENAALLGEAAHVFPPIGAQGFNLGVRDIECLVNVLKRYKNVENRGLQYDRARRSDVYSRTVGVDLLNRSLLSDFLPNQAIRTLGMTALNQLSPLRKMAMKLGISPITSLRG